FAMGGFSIGLLVAGLVAPYVGRTIDRFGGHVVMTIGSLIGALGLLLIVYAKSEFAYYAVWMVLGVAMAANLYDAAFATLGRIFGLGARPPITALTLAGGFASTVSWPATHVLIERVGWSGTYLVYAALLAAIAAPLHALALPRGRLEAEVEIVDGQKKPAKLLPSRGWPFVLQHLPAMHSFLRVCRLICSQYLRVPESTLERSSGLAPCSVQRRSAPGFWSLPSGAICIRSGSYVSPSARFYVPS